MSGVTSRTTSPSSVHRRRSTPCVAGWWGPMLIVKSSTSGSTWVPASGASIRSRVTDSSRRRYGVCRPGLLGLLIPARHLVLVEGVEDGLAAHREVAAKGVPLVVLGHVQAAQVLVAVEAHAEEVEDLLLLEVGGREEVAHRRHAVPLGRLDGETRADAEPLAPLGREQLVVDGEPRLGGEVVGAVEARQHVEALVGLVAHEGEHAVYVLGADVERRLVPEEDRVPYRSLADRRAQPPGHELEARGVDHP